MKYKLTQLLAILTIVVHLLFCIVYYINATAAFMYYLYFIGTTFLLLVAVVTHEYIKEPPLY